MKKRGISSMFAMTYQLQRSTTHVHQLYNLTSLATATLLPYGRLSRIAWIKHQMKMALFCYESACTRRNLMLTNLYQHTYQGSLLTESSLLIQHNRSQIMRWSLTSSPTFQSPGISSEPSYPISQRLSRC